MTARTARVQTGELGSQTLCPLRSSEPRGGEAGRWGKRKLFRVEAVRGWCWGGKEQRFLILDLI